MRCIWADPPKLPAEPTKSEPITRARVLASYGRVLELDVGQILCALYSYGRRLVDERRAERDGAPGAGRGVDRPGASP